MDSKKLEILMTAADLGSLTKASEVVGYTQSGLTHMMDVLEKEIGFPLLQRSHSGIRLSRQGEQLMPAIREFLQANANLENQLYRFRRLCPDVNVDLRMVDHALEPFELLESGQTDMIFASRQQYSCCEWTPLYNERMYAILPRDYPLDGRSSFPIEEFAGQEFLMPYGRFDIDVHAAFEPLSVKPNTRLCKVDDETVIRMVGRGLGVSMMTELMIRGRTDDVLCVPVSPAVIRELGMGVHVRRRMSENMKKLHGCVLAFIRDRA